MYTCHISEFYIFRTFLFDSIEISVIILIKRRGWIMLLLNFYLAITVTELWPFENFRKLRNFQKLTQIKNDDV